MQLADAGAAKLWALALALPGLASTLPARAIEPAPQAASLELRYARYQDFQSQAERMQVSAPSVFVVLPITEQWSARGYAVTDTMSGASPLFHDTLSGASGEGVRDFRRAADVELTRHFERASVSAGFAVSGEDDYLSRALRVAASVDSADRNTSYSASFGYNFDRINSTNDVALGEIKFAQALQFGVTRVLSPQSLLSGSVSYTRGRGYFSDPYKTLDRRPDARSERVLSVRYHRYLAGPDATMRWNYRWYDDSWDVAAHSLEVAWEQSLPRDFTLTPSLRYHTQSAAFFYADPPFGVAFVRGQPYSGDTRLSAFGAGSLGLKLGIPALAGWQSEVKFEFYRQRSAWRAFGSGSPDVELLSARTFEIGIKRAF